MQGLLARFLLISLIPRVLSLTYCLNSVFTTSASLWRLLLLLLRTTILNLETRRWCRKLPKKMFRGIVISLTTTLRGLAIEHDHKQAYA